MSIRHGDPLADRFAEFGRGSTVEWPWVKLAHPVNVAIGENVEVRSHVCIETLATPGDVVLEIGSGTIVGHGVRFVAMNGIVIEPLCGIGHGVTVADSIHDYRQASGEDPPWRTPFMLGPELRLETGSWIGNNSLIIGSVTVGRRAIVAPHSVVTRDVPPDTMVSGNPSRRVPLDRGGSD